MDGQNETCGDLGNTEFSTWQVDVTGHVQGVGYRYFAQRLALELGVTGWVRNAADGSVRAVIQHNDPSVLSRMAVMLKHGPPHGWVTDTAVTPLDNIAPYESFFIRP
jgi:acylphosphatase